MEKDINKIATKIKNNGGTLYLVGGAVRDKLLNRKVKDEDYCVVVLHLNNLKICSQKVSQKENHFKYLN